MCNVEVEILIRRLRHDRAQVWRPKRRDQISGDCTVAVPDRADLPVRPRLSRQPLHDVVAVTRLLRAHDVDGSRGAADTAHTALQRVVSMFSKELQLGRIDLGTIRPVPVVLVDNPGEATSGWGACRRSWSIEVTRQIAAIAQGDL